MSKTPTKMLKWVVCQREIIQQQTNKKTATKVKNCQAWLLRLSCLQHLSTSPERRIPPSFRLKPLLPIIFPRFHYSSSYFRFNTRFQPPQQLTTMLMFREEEELLDALLVWMNLSQGGRFPFGLQICKRLPWRKWHRVLLARSSCSFLHCLEELFELGHRTHENRWKSSQNRIIRLNSSCYFKVATELNVNDVLLGSSIIEMVDHIYKLMFTFIIRKPEKCQV